MIMYTIVNICKLGFGRHSSTTMFYRAVYSCKTIVKRSDIYVRWNKVVILCLPNVRKLCKKAVYDRDDSPWGCFIILYSFLILIFSGCAQSQYYAHYKLHVQISLSDSEYLKKNIITIDIICLKIIYYS